MPAITSQVIQFVDAWVIDAQQFTDNVAQADSTVIDGSVFADEVEFATTPAVIKGYGSFSLGIMLPEAGWSGLFSLGIGDSRYGIMDVCICEEAVVVKCVDGAF